MSLLGATETETTLRPYPDSQMIPAWARASVATAIRSGIYKPNGYMNVNSNASRADIAAYTDTLWLSLNGQLPNPTATIPASNNNVSNNTAIPVTQSVQRTAIIPANTVFNVILDTAITSDRSQLGDAVSAKLERALVSNDGRVIAPAGSEVHGVITALEKPQIAEQSASVTVNFNQLHLMDNRLLGMSAQINTKDGELDAATLPERLMTATKKTATGALLGSGAGILLAAIKDKNQITDYLARGAVIGATAGALSSATDKGKYLLLLPGDTLELKLRQPLVLNYSE